MDVKLPKLGEGADSGVVVNIFVKEGDTVAKGQAILELENEKAVAAIPSTAAGTVSAIFVKGGDRVGVGQKLISVTETGAPAAPAPAAKPAAEKPAGQKVAGDGAGDAEDEVANPNQPLSAKPTRRRSARPRPHPRAFP